MQYIFIFILLFAILFLGSIGFGIFSIRNICSVILLGFGLIKYAKIRFDLNEKIYVIYLILLLLASCLSGNILREGVFKEFITFHIISLIIIISVPVIINSPKILKRVIIVLSIIYVCNCIVTILQYYNVPLGWAIPAYFNDNISDISAQYERYTEREGSAYNISLAAGLFWSSVSNGYFCATVLPIITYKAMSSQFSTKSRAIALLILTIGMVAIFTIQQRAAFALLCVYLLIVFKKFIFSTRHIFAKMIILLVVIAGICTYSTYDVDFGRLTLDKVEGDSRVELLETLSQIPLDDWLCGTDVSNVNLGLSAGHNAILDSFRRGGILCLLLFIVLYLSLLYKSLRIYFRTSKQKHFLQSSLALSCIFFLAYSLLHSVGVQSGSPLFWILYTLMLSSINLEYSHKFITSQSSICKYRTA